MKEGPPQDPPALSPPERAPATDASCAPSISKVSRVTQRGQLSAHPGQALRQALEIKTNKQSPCLPSDESFTSESPSPNASSLPSQKTQLFFLRIFLSCFLFPWCLRTPDLLFQEHPFILLFLAPRVMVLPPKTVLPTDLPNLHFLFWRIHPGSRVSGSVRIWLVYLQGLLHLLAAAPSPPSACGVFPYGWLSAPATLDSRRTFPRCLHWVIPLAVLFSSF